MELRITSFDIGVAIPKTPISANLIAECFIHVRNSKDTKEFMYGFARDHTLGETNSTFGASLLRTEWFTIPYNGKHVKFFHPAFMTVGTIADLSIDGSYMGAGHHVDIDFKLYKKGNPIMEVDKIRILTSGGWQLGATTMRGKLLYFPQYKAKLKVAK